MNLIVKVAFYFYGYMLLNKDLELFSFIAFSIVYWSSRIFPNNYLINIIKVNS